jgi:hypothetical protein
MKACFPRCASCVKATRSRRSSAGAALADSNLVPLFIAGCSFLPTVWTACADAIVHTDVRLVEWEETFRDDKSGGSSVKSTFRPCCRSFSARLHDVPRLAWKSGVSAEVDRAAEAVDRLSALRIQASASKRWTCLPGRMLVHHPFHAAGVAAGVGHEEDSPDISIQNLKPDVAAIMSFFRDFSAEFRFPA